MMPTHGEPHITREQLRALHVSRDVYRWFLRRFPTGGSYQAIHEALIGEGHSAWLESLVDYAYAHSFGALRFLEQEIGSARAMAAQLTHSQAEQLHITPRGHATGRFTPMLSCTLQFASGDHALNIGCSGFQSNLAATGNGNFIGQSGDNGSIANAGYGCQLVSSSFAAKMSNTGQNCRLSALGDRARIANCGNATKISSAGRGTHITSSGRRNYLASQGASTRVANAGDGSHIHTQGAGSRITNSGDNVTLQASGADSVFCSSGSVQQFTLGVGGCAALSYHDGKRLRFITVYEGENGIVAGVTYRLTEQGKIEALDDPLADNSLTRAHCVNG
ncbi:protein YdhT [Candidatus Symbiopectobacterium sp. NZEC127]|uniref:protein YdhT n=1 Tax=Candidatus Symbiopectobacterium sp. NZEC127 TaxID=2820472 RepID=UPI0022278379|nr:protein YdhT [Candidatus Symbiopectobacterium sp. NZEC127]MCW2488279.1 protein YdhT [Candidatus Symbiopectobacterium sp. NZEC127]